MKNFILTAIIALVAISTGLYAQEKDTAQVEPRIKLELVWEKAIPEGIANAVFNKSRAGVLYPSIIVTGENNRSCQSVYFFSKTGEPKQMRKINRLMEIGQALISENGVYVGILEPRKFDAEGDPIGKLTIIDTTGAKVLEQPVWGWLTKISPLGNGAVIEKLMKEEVILKDSSFIVKLDGVYTLQNSKLTHVRKIGNRFNLYPWKPGEIDSRCFLVYDLKTKRSVPFFLSDNLKFLALILPDTIIIHDIVNSTQQLLTGNTISSAVFSCNANFLAGLESTMGKKVLHQSLLLIDISKKSLLWKRDLSVSKNILNVDNRLTHVDVSKAAERIIVAERKNNVYILDVNGNILNKLNFSNNSPIIKVAVSSDGDFLSVVNSGVKRSNESGYVRVYRLKDSR